MTLPILWKTMEEWFRFETNQAVRVAILPEIAEELIKKARTQGVSIETLVNVVLVEHVKKSVEHVG